MSGGNPPRKTRADGRGPARVIEPPGRADPTTEPTATVRWQSRDLRVRTQDLRRALEYLAMLVFASLGSAECGSSPLRVIIDFADGLGQGTLLRVGWVRNGVTYRANADTSIAGAASDAVRWFRVKASAEHSGLLLAVLQVAASHFGLRGCVGARIGRAVSS